MHFKIEKMIISKINFIWVTALLFVLTNVKAQTIHVNQKKSTQSSYELNNVRKLTFDLGNITIQKKDNASIVYALNTINYLYFENAITSVDEQGIAEYNYNISPNPVTDVFNLDLKGFQNKGTIQIMTLDGKVLFEQDTEGKSIVTVNLVSLPKGIYLCRFVNESDSKTFKVNKL
jgi:hypothetical protein